MNAFLDVDEIELGLGENITDVTTLEWYYNNDNNNQGSDSRWHNQTEFRIF